MIDSRHENFTIDFTATTWQYQSTGGWVFVSLPKVFSQQIRKQFKTEEEGWGRLKANAQIGTTAWETAIWFDSKSDAYLLPLKATVRKKEKIKLGDEVEVRITI